MQVIAWKDIPRHDLLCVGRDVKLYSFTHSYEIQILGVGLCEHFFVVTVNSIIASSADSGARKQNEGIVSGDADAGNTGRPA